MITQTELQDLKDRLQKMVVNDMGATMEALKEALPDNAPLLVDLLNLEGQWREHNKAQLNNVVSHENTQLTANQIRLSLISLISSLTLADFDPSQPAKIARRKWYPYLFAVLGLGAVMALIFFINKPSEVLEWFSLSGNKSGFLLYKIPEEMQLDREEECIVRLAFDSVKFVRELARDEVKIKSDIPTTQKMRVEIINPRENDAFRIRNIVNDNVSFIQKDHYVEWVFGVTPLKEGSHPLRLVVYTMRYSEVDTGWIDSEISFKEEVLIKSEVDNQDDFGFKTSGAILTRKSSEEVRHQIEAQAQELRMRNGEDTESISETAREEVVEMEDRITVLFPFNSTRLELDPAIADYLDYLVRDIAGEEVQIILVGHTDHVGPEAYNQDLGRRRAEAIAHWLVSKGLDRSQITIQSRGESEPIASNETPEGRRQNRRVIVYIFEG